MGIKQQWLVVAAGACLAAPAFSGDTKTAFFVAPYLGGTHLKIDADNSDEGVRRGMDLALAGLSVGVRTPIGITFEAGRSDALHDDFSDWWQEGLSLTQAYVAVGYHFDLGGGWSLTPKYGRAKWQLDADDVNFVTEGGEIKDKMKGYENFGELSLAKQLRDSLSLGLTARGLEADFGSAYSGAVSLTWSF